MKKGKVKRTVTKADIDKANEASSRRSPDTPQFQLGDVTKITGTWEVVAVIRGVGGTVEYEVVHAVEPAGVIRIREKLLTKTKTKAAKS